MIHHDYKNSQYWGISESQHEQELLNIVVDISAPVRLLNELITGHVSEGEYCEELKRSVIRYSYLALLAYVKQDQSPLGTSNDNMDKALNCLMDYNLPVMLASEIFHQTETSMMKALLNVIPEIDDERKFSILDHKIIPGNGLFLSLGVKND